MRGDGFQNGGLLVVAARGEPVLYEFRQDNPADHAPNSSIIEALRLNSGSDDKSEPLNVTDLECEEACALPPKEAKGEEDDSLPPQM
ncbi:hypothetical protein SK128_027899 [Halocaridina rubra]|uniref:Uncharacterized protein n=1 Tax=Halocaridina rubra TaxID=373956 RepID=A0AAN8WXC2_HALRR